MVVPWGIDQSLVDDHTGVAVAEGVYRFGANTVNCYVLAGADGLTVVDAGLPDHWDRFRGGLGTIGYDLSDVEALVLTHADPDHIGMAARFREHGVPVHVHGADRDDALAGGGDFPLRDLRHLWRPAFLRFMRSQMRAGVGSVSGFDAAHTFEDGDRLDVPGRPRVVHLPGHTAGHCAFWIPDRAFLFVGDALATMDPLRGTTTGPVPVTIGNADADRAAASVRELASFDHVTLLPGHGNPWTGNLGAALASEVQAAGRPTPGGPVDG